MSAGVKMLLFRATAMMAISRACCQSTNNTIGNLSCVSVVDALFDTSPCYQAAYAFTMNGNTSIDANTVNDVGVGGGMYFPSAQDGFSSAHGPILRNGASNDRFPSILIYERAISYAAGFRNARQYVESYFYHFLP